MEEKSLEFKDIFIEVKNMDKNIKGDYVRLLDGISGKFKSGILTAVMGASGAGKSTLFDVLLGRIESSSKTYGTVKLNGEERSERDWIHKVSYLKQDDIFFSKFNLEESILYNLDFYQTFMSKKAKLDFAEEILKRANIYDKRFAYIDSLSGGERKRAMIALSMCSDPEVIFMDEPTSGLDSHSALTLINFMKTYAAEKNKIVIISVHQPGEALFNLFDEVLYLAKGGVFYNGKVKDIGQWLESKGIAKLEGISLAEFLFELHSDSPFPPEISQLRPKVIDIVEDNRAKYNDLRSQNVLKKGSSNSYFEFSVSFMALVTLIRRFYLNLARTTGLIKSVLLKLALCLLPYSITIVFLMYLLIYCHSISYSFDESSLSAIISYIKSYFTPEMFTNASFFAYLFGANIVFFASTIIFGFFDNVEILREDVYSGKYSILTSFLAYILHDTLCSLYLLSIPFGAIYWSVYRSLINYWYILYSISTLLCCVISYIFFRSLLSSPGKSSKICSILFAAACSAISFDRHDIIIEKLEEYLPESISWLKYISVVWTIFPQFILYSFFRYRRYTCISESGLSEREINTYVPDFRLIIDKKYFEDPKLCFRYFGGENLDTWAIVAIFVTSLLVNIFGALYLYNRQINAYLRLKLA